MDNLNSEIVAKVDSVEYTRSELKSAFDNVLAKNVLPIGDGTAWKYPIEATLSIEELTVSTIAIGFFVGEYPTVNIKGTEVTFSSRGYYNVCGA